MYSSSWKSIIKQQLHLRVKHPQFLPNDSNLEECDENSLIYADFVKPTMRNEWISLE